MLKKCDLCKKEIKRGDKEVIAGLGWLKMAELCYDCGKPVLKFLSQKKLFTKSELVAQ